MEGMGYNLYLASEDLIMQIPYNIRLKFDVDHSSMVRYRSDRDCTAMPLEIFYRNSTYNRELLFLRGER